MHRRRQWHPTPVLLPGKSHGRRRLVGCSPWGHEESDTERLHFHCSLSCIGEGNGNPLQCSCLENPRNGGARWAAIYGVAQSQARLQRHSSSSSSSNSFSKVLDLLILKLFSFEVSNVVKLTSTIYPFSSLKRLLCQCLLGDLGDSPTVSSISRNLASFLRSTM